MRKQPHRDELPLMELPTFLALSALEKSSLRLVLVYGKFYFIIFLYAKGGCTGGNENTKFATCGKVLES